MAVEVGSAVGYLDLDIAGFLNGLKTAQTEANKTSQNMATQVGNKISGMGKSLTSAGSTLTKSMTLPITGAGAAIIKLSSDFESGMSKVSAISGATGGDLDRLKEKAQEMGAKTKFSATEAADAFTYMAMAGWKTEDMLEGIDGIMALAAADGLDLATTSDIVTDALTAFGMSANESGHFADVLAKASSSANTNVSMLGESFKYVAPVAGSLGFTAEDTAIALGLMANAGIKGSQGGTALRGALTKLIKPTDDAAALMEKYNLQLTNSDGSMKSLSEVMKMLRNNLGDLTEAEQANVAANIFGQEAMSGMLAIINASDKDFENLTNQIYNADGAAQQMADTMLDNLGGQVTILKSSLEGLALQFGEIILPYVKKFVEKIQELVQKFQALSPQQKEQIVKWAAILAAIGPVLMIVGKLTSGIGNMITTFGKIPGAITKVKGGFNALHTGFLNMKEGFALSKAGFSGLATEAGGFGTKLGAAAAGITGPMIAIAAVVTALVGAFVYLWKTNEDFRNSIIAIWEKIKATFDKLTSGIVERLNKLGFDFENIGQVIEAIWKGFCDVLAPYFEGVFNYISIVFETFVNVFFGIWDFFHALFTGDWQGCWDAVKGIFESVWNGIKDWFMNIVDTIIGIGQIILGWFGVDFNGGMNEVGNFFKNIWQGIADFFSGIWQGIWAVIGPLFNEIAATFQMAWDVIVLIWDLAKPYFEAIWDAIKTIFSVVADVLGGFFKLAWEGIKIVWDVVVSYFKFIWEGIKAVFSVVATVIGGFFKVAWEAIKAVWDVVVNYFELIWSGIKAVFAVVKGILSGNFSDAWEAIKNVWDKVKDFFQSVWDGIKSVFGSVASFFQNTFQKAWEAVKKVFSAGGKVFDGIKDGIVNGFKTIVNALITGINKVVAIPFNAINGVLKKIRSINILGVKPFTWIHEFSVPQIPKLAKGGIVTAATIAEIGEDGKEAVIPLEKNLGWMNKLANAFVAHLSDFFSSINLRESFLEISGLLSNIKDVCRSILSIGERFIADGIGYVSYSGYVKQGNGIQKEFQQNSDSKSGDTFNFYSPKAIDEIEAAKQVKKAKRELAEGF